MNDGLIYPYLCPAGYPTQGWGTRVQSMSSPPMTQEEADRRLLEHLESLSVQIMPYVHPTLYLASGKLSGVLSWVYNLGIGNLRSSTMRRRLEEADWAEAGRQCRRWVFAGGRKLPGLVLRREMEARLIES